MTDTTTEMLALADYFDDIEVDENGLCKWTDVANAQTHLRAELRASAGAYAAGQRDMQERCVRLAKERAGDANSNAWRGAYRSIGNAIASLPLEAQESDGDAQ